MDNPLAGKVMRNTGGIRKTLLPAPPSGGSGKSGAHRVCYFYFPAFEIIYFVLIFPKKEQPNLTPEQEKVCRAAWPGRSNNRSSTRPMSRPRKRKKEGTQKCDNPQKKPWAICSSRA